MTWCLQHCVSEFDGKPKSMHNEYSKEELEDKAQEASLVAAVVDDALANLPLERGELQVELIDVWVHSRSPTLTLELASAFQEQLVDFQLRH